MLFLLEDHIESKNLAIFIALSPVSMNIKGPNHTDYLKINKLGFLLMLNSIVISILKILKVEKYINYFFINQYSIPFKFNI
jgi:hypothetical protein